MIKELNSRQLKRFCNYSDINFDESIYDNDIIGQPKGAEALKFGLSIKSKGYNIYVAGLSASGKTTFAEKYAREIASKEKTPEDMCYVLNFKNVNVPRLLKLKAGRGRELKRDMEELIDQLSIELPKAFSLPEYEEDKSRIFKAAQKEKDEAIKELTEAAKEYDFGVKVNGNGSIYFLPIVDGKIISEEEYEELDENRKEDISEGSDEVHELAGKTMKLIKEIDIRTQNKIEEMDYNTGLMTVGRFLGRLQEKYADNEMVSQYLSDVKEDMLDHIDSFAIEAPERSEDPLSAVMPFIAKRSSEEFLRKYDVNLIVDNSSLKGAPVIVSYNPTYANLVGEIEYENENGNLVTDFMKIKAGLLHKANGGYIIFHASDLFNNLFAWETLKRALKTNKVTIEPMKEYQLGGLAVAGIQPESAEIDVKIIIIGSMYYYELIKAYDDDFNRLFKICSLFDYEMDYSNENISATLGFIKGYAEREKTLPVNKNAMCELLEYSIRLSERQDKLSTRFGIIGDILAEANTWAVLEGAKSISEKHIKKAIDKKLERMDIYARKYSQMINDNEIFIDTQGSKVGQINGLCVMETGDYTFGLPTRITASTYMGKAGIVNIEKEAEMSGTVHDKGVQVLTGYLGSKYAQDFPLTLSCRICFEQSYSGIDGDSASSTETYAIISSLANVPVNQGLAVTGSMNQKGEIQPIGGVTYKIEGFYDVCKARGFTGMQGCIIPRSNIKDLVLRDDIIASVKKGEFHIYAIDTIDDGIELLMGRKAGKNLARGGYSKDSIHALVYEKLKGYYKKSTN